MNTSEIEKLIKKIIDGMYRNYNYSIEDFSSIKNNGISWALSKKSQDRTKKIIHFINLGKETVKENLESDISNKFNCQREDIISVILVTEGKNHDEIKYQINELRNINSLGSNFIILDLINSEIQISEGSLGDLANQIANIAFNNNRISSNRQKAFITYGIIGINIVMFIISAVLSKHIMTIDKDVLVNLGAKYNPAIQQGQWFRLITCMFLHGGLIHITANMYSLYSIGPLVEQLYGKYKYIVIYLICGVISSLFSFFFSDYVSIGASGAIFGLLGVVFVFAIKERKRIGRGFLMNVASVVVMNLILGISLPGIDNFAHLGGLISGITLGSVLKLGKN